jgi:hypothetical protein
MGHLEVVVKHVVAPRDIILNRIVTHANIIGSKPPSPMSFNLKHKGVGSNGGKRGVFHHWERFNSHEGLAWSHGDTLR